MSNITVLYVDGVRKLWVTKKVAKAEGIVKGEELSIAKAYKLHTDYTEGTDYGPVNPSEFEED